MRLTLNILRLAGAMLLTASPLAIAKAQESAAQPPISMQLAQDDQGAGPDEQLPRKKRRQQQDQGAGGGGGGPAQAEGDQGQPRRRKQQAQPDFQGEPQQSQEVQPKRRKPQQAQPDIQGEPQPQQSQEVQPRRRKQQAQPDLQGEPQPQQQDDGQGQPRRRKPQQAQPDIQGEPQQADDGQGQPKRRKPQQAQPDIQGEPQQADDSQGQPKRRKPQQAQPDIQGEPQQADDTQGQPKRRKPQQAEPLQAEPQQNANQPEQGGAGQGRPKAVDQGRPVDQAKPADAGTSPGGTAEGGGQQDNRRAADLSDEELRARLQTARQKLRGKSLSEGERAALQDELAGSRKELQVRQARGKGKLGGTDVGQPGVGDGVDQGEPGGRPVVNLPRGGEPNPAVDKPRVNQQADNNAGSILEDSTPADKLDDKALRGRLGRYRATLAEGNISPEREREMRRRLAADREILRSRVSIQEEQQWNRPRQGAGGRPAFDDRPVIIRPPTREETRQIIADRRRSRDLDEIQLNRRIRVYRDMIDDQRYSATEREEYVRFLEDDRRELRNRMVYERGQRADRWREARDNRDVDVDVEVDIDLIESPQRPRQVTIWAAEVDDEAIEEQLVARPLGPIGPRYTREQILREPEVVMAQPEVRRSIPSVEIDTVRFGFNEAFVREEEIANLERIGKIIEKIVAAHPNEVFMIEGHTDAVGDDAYNVDLSKKRAEAVKQALTEYYVIAPENLATVGLGERYLKIPTGEEEAENRRVTLRRMTSIVQK